MYDITIDNCGRECNDRFDFMFCAHDSPNIPLRSGIIHTSTTQNTGRALR